MDASDPFIRRHGIKPKHSRFGTLMFFIGIAAVVAGLGVAGLYYGRPEVWDQHASAGPVATDVPPEPVGKAEVTSAETKPASEQAKPVEPPMPLVAPEPAAEAKKPVARPAPIRANARPRTAPKKEPEATAEPAAEADPFATTH